MARGQTRKVAALLAGDDPSRHRRVTPNRMAIRLAWLLDQLPTWGTKGSIAGVA